MYVLNEKIETIYNNIQHRFEIKNEALNYEDAQYLSKKLKESPTVVSREPHRLVEQAWEKSFLSIVAQDKIIWFILMDVYPQNFRWVNIHERMSLWVDEEYRWNNLWTYLMLKITDQFAWKSIVSCTQSKQVWHVNKKYLWYEEVYIENISEELMDILESGWPLQWKWYQFYFNQHLLKVISWVKK